MKRLMKYAFVLCLFVLASCNKEQGVINDYTDLVEELETSGRDFDEQQWEEFFQQCEKLETKMDQCSFSKEQRKEIRKLHGRMTVAMGKLSGKLIKNAMKDAVEMIGTFSESFMDGLGEDEE